MGRAQYFTKPSVKNLTLVHGPNMRKPRVNPISKAVLVKEEERERMGGRRRRAHPRQVYESFVPPPKRQNAAAKRHIIFVHEFTRRLRRAGGSCCCYSSKKSTNPNNLNKNEICELSEFVQSSHPQTRMNTIFLLPFFDSVTLVCEF